ncbi:hypothetical protein [Pseudomonas sp. 210_17 TE3656]
MLDEGGMVFSVPVTQELTGSELKFAAVQKRDIFLAETNLATNGMVDALVIGPLSE